MCNVNIYEWGSGTESGTIDQTHLDAITAGAGTGTVSALQSLLNIQAYGMQAQSYFALAEFQNGSLNGNTIKAWGITVDMGGATNNVRPQFLGISLVNRSIIGPMYACPITNNVTYNFAGSPLNGTTIPPGTPALASVPYLYSFCFQNGSNRSMVLINTDVTGSHSVSFTGTNVPSGTVTQRQYAPGSPDLLNEAPTGSNSNATPASVFVTSAQITAPTSMTLPPLSVTAIDFTAGTTGGTPTVATPVISVASGTYTSAQSVMITDSTPSSTIYYTLDGTTPTTNSAVYTGAISVGTTESLMAMATAAGNTNSAVANASYTINLAAPSAATPAFSVAGGTYTSTQTVSISDSTAGATIYYTTNGATPTTSSAVYGAPVVVSSSETLKAIAAGASISPSAVATAAYTINFPAAATPTFSVAAGSYAAAQTVSVNDGTAGAIIYYTTNGSTPTTSSTIYGAPITVSSTETVKAIADGTTTSPSAVASATYTINGTTATPTFSVGSGTYSSKQTVSITDATSGAAIYYTTNGATPTTSSSAYAGAITVSSTETLKAIAVASSFSTSGVASATYTINSTPAAAPTFSIAGGTYYGNQTVTMSDTTGGAVIHYTTNHTTPTASSAVYSAPIAVDGAETIEAIAMATGSAASPVTVAAYGLTAHTPAFSVAAGSYTSEQSLTMSDLSPGAIIYYTTDGRTPTTLSTVYSGPIDLKTSQMIKAVASVKNYNLSATAVANYTLTIAPEPPAATPTLSLAQGTYAIAQYVRLLDATPGAVIHFTTNGATPTASSAVYTTPLSVNKTMKIEAIAIAPKFSSSKVGIGSYTLNKVLYAPKLSLLTGTYQSEQTLAMSDQTLGSVIHYTTNGTTPTASSAIYKTPITVNATMTVKAIATDSGLTPSAVSSAVYSFLAATPTISLKTGTYSAAQTATLKTSTVGAKIYYTLNNATPTTASTLYTAPVAIKATENLKAISALTGYRTSAVATGSYTLVATAPSFSVDSGTYTLIQSVTLKSNTSGAKIFYTLNGATPTTSSTLYTAPVSIRTSETLKAIAAATGLKASSVSSEVYSLVVASPQISVKSGTFSSSSKPTVTLSCVTPGAKMYYTTNDTTPTTASKLYTAPIKITASATLKVLAIASGFKTSQVSAAKYVVN